MGCRKLIVGPTVGCIVFFGCCTGYVGVTALGGKGDVELKTEVTKVVGTTAVDSFVGSGEVASKVPGWVRLVLGRGMGRRW